MNFNENELFGAALIGFDMIDGPFLKWKKEYNRTKNMVAIDDFAMNFYLAFRGGNASAKKPKAILYDNFYIVAFPRDLELCCLFMKPQDLNENFKQLNKVASRIITEMEINEPEKEIPQQSDENTVEEMKRIIPNLLTENKMSTPELRRYFKISNSQIWKLMSSLENSNIIKRAEKKGRTIYWTTV
jgi:biotin operon repressor